MEKMNREVKVFKGYWWLAKSPNNKIAGILTINGNEITLELFGSFASSFKELLCIQVENLIYGTDSNGKDITLVNCHNSFVYNGSSEFPIEKYDCLRAVYGKHIGGLLEKRNYSAYMYFSELPYWAHPNAIHINTSDFENFTFSISSHKNNLLCVELTETTRLIFCGGAFFNGKERYLSPDLWQTTYVKLVSDEAISISEIEQYMRRLSSFLSIAFLSDVNCTKLYLTTPENSQTFESGQPYYSNIDIYWPKNNGDIQSNKIKCIFDLNDIQTNASEIVRKWMTSSKVILPIMLHLVDSLKKKPTFSSVDFLIVIQAIDGYWLRFREFDYRKKRITQTKQGFL